MEGRAGPSEREVREGGRRSSGGLHLYSVE